ncbi:MAG: CapA family protein, partial [Anaerolineaceae bacterium]|nr:CapA family protein [Anaerolineaceae bacterium]
MKYTYSFATGTEAVEIGSEWASLLEEMNRVDLMVINNEFPYTDRGAPQPEKIYTFHAMPRTVRQLKEM